MRHARGFVALCFAVTVGVVSAATPADGAQRVGTWRATGAPLSADVRLTATLADGRVLALYAVTEYEYGPGYRPGTQMVIRARSHLASEFYDPSSRIWAAGPDAPGEEASTLVALPGGGALLLGETACERQPVSVGSPLPYTVYRTVCRPTDATYRLNASGSEWAPARAMLAPRASPGVARLRDGRILLAGGVGASCTVVAISVLATASSLGGGYSCAPLASAEIFNPAAGTWTATAPMPYAAEELAAATLSDGTVLLLRGEPRYPIRFDPRRGNWTALPPPPEPVGGDLLALPGDRAIALGGQRIAFIGSKPLPFKRRRFGCETPQIYSALSGKWTTGAPLPGPPTQLDRECVGGAVPLAGGQILAGRTVLIDHQRCWVTTGPRASDTEGGSLIPLPDGGALAVNGSGSDAAAETYEPAPDRCDATQLTRADLFGHITPRGGVLTPRRLLSRGYPLIVHTAAPGDVRVNWYITLQLREGTERVLIADGGAHASGSGPVKVVVRLTPRGELELADQMSVEAQGVFASGSQSPLIVLRDFTIKEPAGRPAVA
jgi:hypothetical protein